MAPPKAKGTESSNKQQKTADMGDGEGTPNKEDETNKGIDELVTTDDDAKGTRKNDGANNANNPNAPDRGTDPVSNIQHFPFWNLQLLLF